MRAIRAASRTESVVERAPRVVTHTSKPEWGRGVVSSQLDDRAVYVFEHGGERTFMSASPALVDVPISAADRDVLIGALLRRGGPTARPVRVRAVRPKVGAAPITFAGQVALFRAAFPGGFEDERFVREERGAKSGADRKKEGAIRTARELLAEARLTRAIEKGAFSEVHADARRVVAAMGSLALPKRESAAFDRLPEGTHPRFARALVAMLYGKGAHAARFDELVASLDPTSWTIATLFAASVHPSEHVFVKAAMSQRQARALGLAEPIGDAPSGAAYAQHLGVARAVEARLAAAGMKPRDLLDVYSFGWRTLTRAAASQAATA